MSLTFPLQTSPSRADESRLLMKVFQLWFAIRRTATTEHIDGTDKLDIAEVKIKSSPHFGKVPLPPVMIQQLDMILILRVLRPLHKEVLEKFHKLLISGKPESSMTVYLITFMLLHSCGMITRENFENARKHGLRVS
jgi:hypothetical protein